MVLLKSLGKYASVLCIVLLLIVMPLSLLLLNLGNFVFNHERVEQYVIEQAFQSDLVPIVLEWFSNQRAQERVEGGEALTDIDEPNIVLLMSVLDRGSWRLITEEVLSEDILQSLITTTIDSVYAWIDSNDALPEITWDLTAFKERVSTDFGRNAIVIAYDNLLPCTDEEIEDFLSRLEIAPPGADVLYNLCEFPDPWHSDQLGDYVESLEELVNNIPDEYALVEELSALGKLEINHPERIKQWLRFMRRTANLAWLAPVVLLILILIFVVRSFRDLALWWGVALLGSGVITAVLSVLYPLLFNIFLASRIFVELSTSIRDGIIRFIQGFMAEGFKTLLIQAVILSLLGLGMLIWLMVKRKQVER